MPAPLDPTPAAPVASATMPETPAAPAPPPLPAAAAAPATPAPDPMAAMVAVMAGFQAALDKLTGKLDTLAAPAAPAPVAPPAAAAPAAPAPAPAAPATPAPDAGLDPLTKMALRVHLGELKSPDYADMVPKGIKANPDGSLTDAHKALADEWKRNHPDLFKLAIGTGTPAGGPPAGAPLMAPEQQEWLTKQNISVEEIAKRPVMKAFGHVIGWQSARPGTGNQQGAN